jgi:hypothetical protein
MHIEPGVLAAGKIMVANAAALGVIGGSLLMASRRPSESPRTRITRVAWQPWAKLWFDTKHAQGTA